MAVVYLGLGSNLGDRADYLKRALERIARLPKTKVIKTSSWHETDPVGGPPQDKFLNGVAQLETKLKPIDLLDRLLQIELDLGRTAQREKWGPRVIDLDLLDYDGLSLQLRQLNLPHPLMHERTFVLAPLAEIAPTWKHPLLEATAFALLEKMTHADRPKTG